MVQPILEDALKDPDINRSAIGGAGIAGILLFIPPRTHEMMTQLMAYMQRPDLTDRDRLGLIQCMSPGIDRGAITDSGVLNVLVSYLDRPDDLVKAAALALIEKGGPVAKDAARSRVARMASDPKESPEVRQSAAAVLKDKSPFVPGGAQSKPQ